MEVSNVEIAVLICFLLLICIIQSFLCYLSVWLQQAVYIFSDLFKIYPLPY